MIQRLKLNPHHHIFNRLQSIAALLISFCVMCIGHSLLNTVVGLRAAAESYSDLTIALMTSAYFMGFIVGTMLCAALINHVGHIRTFGIFASAASAVTLGLVIHVHPATWFFARLIYGACIAALYMVMESWLNMICKNEERGQILSFYMITNYVGMAASQALIYFASPTSFTLFAVASIFLSAALIPLSASQTPQPFEIKGETFSLKKAFYTSQLATIGSFSSGFVLGSFWGFGAVFLTKIGMTNTQVAMFIGLFYLGALFMQWPVGYMSDRLGRRKMIASIEVIAAVVALFMFLARFDGSSGMVVAYMISAFIFGGVNNTLHSLFIALMNDFLKPEQAVRASGTLLNVHAIGAIIGPIIATPLIAMTSDNGLMLFCALTSMSVFGFAVYQIFNGRKIPKATTGEFVAVPRASLNVYQLYAEEEEQSPPPDTPTSTSS